MFRRLPLARSIVSRPPPFQVSDERLSDDPGAGPPGWIVPPAASVVLLSTVPMPVSVPPALTANEPPAATLPSTLRMPPFTATFPAHVFAAVSASVPAPILVKPPAPETVPLNVMSAAASAASAALIVTFPPAGSVIGTDVAQLALAPSVPLLKLRLVANVPVPFLTMPPAPRYSEPPLSVTVAEPAVTVASKPSVSFSAVLTPPVNWAIATLFAFVPLVRAITMPLTVSVDVKVPPCTRIAPPRAAVTWLGTVTVPVAISEPPLTLSAPFELLVPRPTVPTVTVPPFTMKPELKSGLPALLRRMLTSVAVKVPPLIRNVLPESEFVRTAPNDALPESSWNTAGTLPLPVPLPTVTRPPALM